MREWLLCEPHKIGRPSTECQPAQLRVLSGTSLSIYDLIYLTSVLPNKTCALRFTFAKQDSRALLYFGRCYAVFPPFVDAGNAITSASVNRVNPHLTHYNNEIMQWKHSNLIWPGTEEDDSLIVGCLHSQNHAHALGSFAGLGISE